MDTSVLIQRRSDNEFIFEYDTQKDAAEMKSGFEFDYDDAKFKVMLVKPGISGPSVYTFLVIAEMLE